VLTALEVAPEVEDLPHAEREERAKREEEEVADPVVGRLCKNSQVECMRCRQLAGLVEATE